MPNVEKIIEWLAVGFMIFYVIMPSLWLRLLQILDPYFWGAKSDVTFLKRHGNQATYLLFEYYTRLFRSGTKCHIVITLTIRFPELSILYYTLELSKSAGDYPFLSTRYLNRNQLARLAALPHLKSRMVSLRMLEKAAKKALKLERNSFADIGTCQKGLDLR
jgi:hypothetical protein